MRVLIHIALIMVLLSSASCGQFVDLDGEGGTTATTRQKAGMGFIGGGAHSKSPHYDVDHRINIAPTDGVQRGPHYEIRPGY